MWAFGRGEESWLVARHIIYGGPNRDENTEATPWTHLTEIRRTPIVHAAAARLSSKPLASTQEATTLTPR